MSLQAQIDANGDADGALQSMVTSNEALITTLTQSVSDMETSLQDQIDNNNQLIELMQQDLLAIEQALVMKQNRVDGLCPDGSAIQTIQEDGSVTCQSGGAQEGGFETSMAYGLPSYFASVATCPDGYTMTGCGYDGYSAWYPNNFNQIIPAGSPRFPDWYPRYGIPIPTKDACVVEGYDYYYTLTAVARCIRVAP